jgi:prepilin-type N-terminal cleavage/methylation domain-containing protein
MYLKDNRRVVSRDMCLCCRKAGTEEAFSLMEVLVGVAILGIVYATLFSLMSTSLRTISRIEEREKIVRYGQMKMNELVLNANRGILVQGLSGRFDDRYSWQATIQPFDSGENADRLPDHMVAKVRLSVIGSNPSQQSQYTLETLTWAPNGR